MTKSDGFGVGVYIELMSLRPIGNNFISVQFECWEGREKAEAKFVVAFAVDTSRSGLEMSSLVRYRDDMTDAGAKLTEAFNSGDTEALQLILSEVVGEMTTGMDVSSLFPYVVKMCGTMDLTCKKLVYLYISQYARDKPDLTLLAVNSLQKDAADPNAMVRGLALKTLCNIRLQDFLEYVKKPLLSGLKDRSPYVRQIAVTGCLKVHRISSKFAKDHGIPNVEEMLHDPDPTVVISVLRTYFEMGRAEDKSPSLRQKMAIHILNKLPEFNDWGKASALQYLMVYQPQGEEEVLDILNLLDPMLEHNNSSVSVAAVKLMLHYTEDMPNIQKDIYKKLRGVLVNLLSHEQEEMVYLSLCHLHQLQKNSCINLSKHYKKLFCRYNDSVHIKCLKIQLLELICTDKNWEEILEELNSHCLDISAEVSEKAIGDISYIARQKPVCAESCMRMVLNLLEIDRAAGSALNALKDLLDLDDFQQYLPEVLQEIPSLWSRIDDQKGKIAMLWIIGQHGKDIPDAPYLLELMIDRLEEISRPLVISSLLTATTKLFFSRPAECQDMLGKLLEYSVVTQEDMFLKEKGQLYYRLLSEDVTLAKEVICSAKFRDVEVSNGNRKLDLNSLQMFSKPKSVSTSTKCPSTELRQRTEADTTATVTPPTEGQLIDISGGEAEVKDREVEGQEETPHSVVTNDAIVGTAAESLASLSISGDKSVDTAAESPAGVGNPILGSGQELDESVCHDAGEREHIEGSILQLDKSFTLSPEEFESKWTSLEDGGIEQVRVTFDLTTSLDILEAHGINTMASTTEGIYPWKAFLYAKDSDSNATFLIEVMINTEGGSFADVQLKCTTDSETIRAKFRSLLEETLSKGV